jgi:hypothetical protein
MGFFDICLDLLRSFFFLCFISNLDLCFLSVAKVHEECLSKLILVHIQLQ